MLPSRRFRRGQSRPPAPAGPARFIGGIFGFAFLGIGLTVLGFLWGSSGFHSPPLVFKLFGSFIAIVFVGVGGATFFSAITGKSTRPGAHQAPPPGANDGAGTATGSGYTCPGCGARLGDDADVSPKGDVKCGYCRQWFNIHG